MSCEHEKQTQCEHDVKRCLERCEHKKNQMFTGFLEISSNSWERFIGFGDGFNTASA
jgi:hypothetical protein